MMHSENSQSNAIQNLLQNPQVLQTLAQALSQNQQGGGQGGYGQGGLGQGAFGQGAFGQGGLGQGAFGQQGGFGQGGQSGWGQQRQLTPMDVSAILQQIAPVLPQIVAQAQQAYQPLAAFGGGQQYGGLGGQFGQQRNLAHHEVSEIVRQILPAILQATQQQQNPFGGQGQGSVWGMGAFGQSQQNPWQQQNPFQQWGSHQQGQHRQIGQQDVQEIARQVVEAVTGNQQGQQRQF